MDIGALANALTTALVPLLPYLLKAGEKAAEESGKIVAGQSWEWAKSLWIKLKPKVEAKQAALEAAQDVAHAPDDEDLQATLRVQLRKLLAEDQSLAEELRRLLGKGEAASYNVSASQRSVAMGDHNERNKIFSGNNNALKDVSVSGDYYEIQVTDPEQFERNVSKDEQPFDGEIYRGSEWGHLKIDAIDEFLALKRVQLQDDYNPALSRKQQFEEFGFVSEGAKPTNGANLCFGESPNKAVAGCQTKCFYWKDNSRSTGFHDDKTLSGNLVSQMNGALLFIKRYLRLERNIGEDGRSDEYDLPIIAIQEAIANALVHREYRNRYESVQIDLFDERIEIVSPGGLPQDIPLEVLVSDPWSNPRNPLIARIFYLYGYVEHAGTGINRMKWAMSARGLPEPEFKVGRNNTFRVILRRSLPAVLATHGRQPHEIPSPPADFTGREDELKELLASIKTGGVTISGLQGMGGIGKTALAFKLVEQLKSGYPDAQFYLDLKGSSAQPLTVAETLAHVVRAYHPAAKLPDSESELRRLYLSVLSGQRALLLMDNAANAEQVEPLIPPAGCLLLVTSRQHFTVPGLAAKNLDTLSAADARALLLTIAPRIGTQANEIAALCGHLPLALRLAAAAMVKYRNLSPADYVRRLQDRQQRLQLIDASLSLSYELLSEELRERWRWLAVFPDTFAGDAAAAVWEVELDQATDILGELMATSLVAWNETSGRYHLHDLARLFADAKLSAEERAVGQKRFATHYSEVLSAANELYLEGGESLLRGLALFDLEWGNIQAGHAWVVAQADAPDADVARLGLTYPDAGVYVLDLRQHSRERIRWLEIALAAARRLQDREGEGAALGNLGLAYTNLGETRRAIQFHEQTLLIHREIGDRRGEGNDLGNLGTAYAALGETRRAVQFYEQNLAIAREIGDRRSEGNALGNLGGAFFMMGETRRAIEFYELRLLIARELGDRRGEGNALGNLGNAYAALGETRRAIQFNEQNLAISREIGDRRGEGSALWNMSLALDQLGERGRAIQHAEQALTIFEQIEDPNVTKVRTQIALWRTLNETTVTTHGERSVAIGGDVSVSQIITGDHNVIDISPLHDDLDVD